MTTSQKVQTATGFLSWLRPGGPWTLTAIIPDGATLTETTEDVDGFIKQHDGKRNIYYSLNPTCCLKKKSSKADMIRAEFLLADCDPNDGETPDEAKARYLAVAENFQPRPSAAIDSGNGVQFLWRLEVPLADPLASEAYNKAIMLAFGTKAGTQNCDRILRLPCTTNLPNKAKRDRGLVPCPSSALWLEDTRYPISAFPVGEAEKARQESEERLKEAWKEQPKPQFDIDNFSVDTCSHITEELRAIIKELKYERWKGDRSRGIFYVTCELLRLGLADVLVERILLDPKLKISEHCRAQGNPTRAAKRVMAAARLANEEFKKGEDGKIIATSQHNVRVAVSKLGVSIVYDEFADRLLLSGLAGYGPVFDDHALNRLWLLIDERFKFRPSVNFLMTVVEDDAINLRRFHPVRDYLDALKWDGQPRLEAWLHTYGGAPDRPFVRAVGRIMLVAAVRRIRKPGTKFDQIVVFESPVQGKLKSTALAIMCGQEWFSDCLPLNAAAKEVMEITRGKWMAEAADLSGMRKADIDKLKAFASRTHDRARMAYGRLVEEVPRSFITVGTTNSKEYLRDQTGNRRFWPIEIAKFDADALTRDRDQLWAEASHREAAGESIILPEELWSDAGAEQEERTLVDPFFDTLADKLAEFLDEPIAIKSEDIWKLLEVKPDRRTADMKNRMGESIRRLGFEKPNSGGTLWVDKKLVSGYVRGQPKEGEKRTLIIAYYDLNAKEIRAWREGEQPGPEEM